jgi:UDP-N-acetylmuramyl pentapeptide synthase
MRLDKLLEKLEMSGLEHTLLLPENGGAEVRTEITRLVSDSRKAGHGSIFACVIGEHSDGHDYAEKPTDRVQRRFSANAGWICRYPR